MKDFNHFEVVEHVMNCKLCLEAIQIFQAQRAGSTTSADKARAARENGKKGGRPRKNVSCE